MGVVNVHNKQHRTNGSSSTASAPHAPSSGGFSSAIAPHASAGGFSVAESADDLRRPTNGQHRPEEATAEPSWPGSPRKGEDDDARQTSYGTPSRRNGSGTNGAGYVNGRRNHHGTEGVGVNGNHRIGDVHGSGHYGSGGVNGTGGLNGSGSHRANDSGGAGTIVNGTDTGGGGPSRRDLGGGWRMNGANGRGNGASGRLTEVNGSGLKHGTSASWVYREAEASGINGVLNGSCGEEDEETSSPDNGNYFLSTGSVNCTRIREPMQNLNDTLRN
jgi:hypothetical protein